MSAAAPTPEKLMRKLEWRVRNAVDSVLGGEYRSALRGRGREFDQVVRYEYGDDIRDLDWNVTARLGEPYRKKFIEERELTVVLLFEDSLSLQFGSGDRTKREALLEMAGLLALLSAGNRDRLGTWRATPGGEHSVHRPARGRGRIIRIAANLLAQPAPRLQDLGGGEIEIDWSLFAHAFPRHSVVVWLGDFPPRDPPPGWRALRRRYDVIGIRVDDPWERSLPRAGAIAALDPTTGELIPFDTSSSGNQRRHSQWVRERDDAFERHFPSPHEQLRLGTTDDPLDALVRFFRARMRVRRP